MPIDPSFFEDGDSDVAKPDKFTGKEPRKLRPFISSCIMMFDAKPRKYATDRQRVSFAASYLADLAEQWWSPTLLTIPEAPIRRD
jgi:hypothetical protein